MTKLQPYPEYRESGIEWLGDIPIDWEVSKFRYCFRESAEVNGTIIIGEMLSISGYRGVEQKVYDDENQKRDADQLETYRVVRKGQLAVNTMWLNYSGLGISDLEGHMSPAYRAYWVERDANLRYIHHLVRSQTFVDAYTSFLTGIRPNSLQMSRANLMNFPVLLPPRHEQDAIATFLDRETAQISELISKQERLIELLSEKRQAVITHAVTKGLDPAAATKPSGIPWAGSIPATWSVQRTSWLFNTIASGTTPPSDKPEYYDGDTNWVTTGELREKPIRDTSKKVSSVALAEFPTLRLYPSGTLLMAMYGATIGRLGILAEPATTNQACCAFSEPIRVTSKFVFYAMMAAKEHLLVMASGGGQPNINQEKIRALRFPLPEIDEQIRIVDWLETKLSKIDALIDRAEGMIRLLKERRSALISAAVTGRIDTRK